MKIVSICILRHGIKFHLNGFCVNPKGRSVNNKGDWLWINRSFIALPELSVVFWRLYLQVKSRVILHQSVCGANREKRSVNDYKSQGT